MSPSTAPRTGSARHDQVVAELYSRWPEHRIAPSLARIQALCDLLGSPERATPVIQVAGTNGKGSTAIIIDALLRAAGLRTGRMTSPHLVDVRERISIDGEPIASELFDELYEQIAPMIAMVDDQLLDGVRMTAFEVFTALGFAAFVDAPVDVAVVEVGMGGSWDATNVADATVAVVCPIDFDHMHILGSTIGEIAGEKAGIIKPGSIAVLAAQRPEAATVLLDRCAQVGATPVLEGVDFGVIDRENAAVAVAAVEHFLGGGGLDPAVINDGFAGVVAPARLEVLRRSPTVLLDTAHNPHAARAMIDTVNENFAFPRLIGVVSMMRDKNVDEVLGVFAEAMTDVVVTRVSSTDRALDIDELADRASGVFGADLVDTAPTYAEALDLAMRLADEAGPAAGVLIAGSVIGAGEARALLAPDTDAARARVVSVGVGLTADDPESDPWTEADR